MFRTLAFLLLGSIAAMAQVAPFAERDPRYRLQANDVLDLQYRYTPEFNQTVTLQPDGFVNLQIVGDLKLEGLTLDEARAKIVDKARVRLNDPELTLILKDFQKPHFVVAGEVTTPGRYDLRGRVTAIEAVAMAGGFKPSAKHSQVILFRQVTPELAQTKLIDVKHLMTAPNIQEDVALQPGDILLVPQNRISKIERLVKIANVGVYWNPLTH